MWPTTAVKRYNSGGGGKEEERVEAAVFGLGLAEPLTFKLRPITAGIAGGIDGPLKFAFNTILGISALSKPQEWPSSTTFYHLQSSAAGTPTKCYPRHSHHQNGGFGRRHGSQGLWAWESGLVVCAVTRRRRIAARLKEVFDAVYNDARASTAMLVALVLSPHPPSPPPLSVLTHAIKYPGLHIPHPPTSIPHITQALKHSNLPRPNLQNASVLKTSTLQELADDEGYLCLCYLDWPSLQPQCLFSMVHIDTKNSTQSFYSRQVLVKCATVQIIIPLKFLQTLAERFKIYCINGSYNIPPSTSCESSQRALDSEIEPSNLSPAVVVLVYYIHVFFFVLIE
ncbi:hypothetical protein C8J57DRAFT_1473600 [Mycena rebaudengoi]|nr:hypothetical protein C8J57DRAFT_1473600 [Mycena rebaudengoi]